MVAASESPIVTALELAVDAFLVIHVGLHERLHARDEVAFRSRFSRSFIRAGAALGGLSVAMVVVG